VRWAALLTAGCLAGCAGNLPRISDQATISVWRSMPGWGARTGARVIAGDLRTDRQIFLQFYRHAREVGVCDPVALHRSLDARGLMIVQFAESGRVVCELHVLQGRDGRPLTTGHGPIDAAVRGPDCPQYRYRRRDVNALHAWFQARRPEDDSEAPRRRRRTRPRRP